MYMLWVGGFYVYVRMCEIFFLTKCIVYFHMVTDTSPCDDNSTNTTTGEGACEQTCQCVNETGWLNDNNISVFVLACTVRLHIHKHTCKHTHTHTHTHVRACAYTYIHTQKK